VPTGRLLLAARGGGGFTPSDAGQDDEDYTMTEDEVAYWQDQAALLDPDAYEYVQGINLTRTVTAGQNWYLVSGWYLTASGGGLHFFHRERGVFDPLPLPAGRAVTTHASFVGSAMYLCKPALVIPGDSRYTSDPRGLYFERKRRIATELTQYTIGTTITGSGQTTTAFPTDFTDGLVIHVATHDLAWVILKFDNDGGPILQPEISDIDPVRFANTVVMPFKRTTFANILAQGANEAQGRASIVYLKLPGDW
jgi:hypothetical protein